ncbi:MAG: hypothetical protein K8S25_17050 [Alphaproteobacteria bacterium]|nr:hypothetical protein [Alphaproteobacteria bacterium]
MALAFLAHPAFAHAATRVPPIITGNAWAALGIIGVLVGVIYLLIRGALHIEDRDARFSGGRRSRDDDGWFGFFPHRGDDDDDGHGFHHHDGGDGGEAGAA